MPRFLLPALTRRNTFLALCALALLSLHVPVSLAQRPVGVPRPSGGPRVPAPDPRPAIPQTRVFPSASPGVGPTFHFGPHPFHVFPHRVFIGAPFFRSNSFWFPGCVPSLSWGWGADCYVPPSYGPPASYFVTLPPYQPPLYVYGYGAGGPELIWLYMKDGAVYPATDYWFVNGQMHFTMPGEDPTKPSERVLPFDSLDVQKTVFVNSRRGFRMVMRDLPWPQYLKDHPDSTPPPLQPPLN